MKTPIFVGLFVFIFSVSGVPVADEAPSASQPKISYSRETVAKPGEDVTIDCGVEGVDLSGVQDFSVSWSKIDLEKPTNSYPISTGEQVLIFSSRYEVIHPAETYQYSLKILNLGEDDTGTYRCTVNFGDDQKINAEVPVLIEKAPYFVDPSTKTLTVTEGDAISIDCQPGGSPTPTVFWERVNHNLPFYGGNFFKDNQLDIPLVEASHRGHYVCHADNGIGNPAKSEVILSVHYLPKMTVPTVPVPASIGKEVSVLCSVDANPPAIISWFKDGEVILGSVNTRVSQQYGDLPEEDSSSQYETVKPRTVKSTLTIEQVTYDDLGNYSCLATNSVGSTNKTVQISLKTPPKIVSQSSRRLFYNDGEDFGRDTLPISVECRASGIPEPEYRWTKNNEVLIWQSNPRMSIEPSTGTLLIENPTVKDNGWYQCVAYNDLGVAKSDPVYLLNATRVTFDMQDKPVKELVAEEGRPFRMDCPKATADPKPEITWAIAGQVEDGQTKMQFFSSNRTVVGPDGSAYFTHVIKEDDSEVSGITYMCLGVTEMSPQDFSLGTTVKLKVVKPEDGIENGQENHLNIEPFIMYASPNYTVLKGDQENKLWCIFGGEPVPDIVWERLDGKPMLLSDYTLINHNSTLVINNTNLAHAATYKCTASNRVGPTSTHTMVVQVDMPPVFREVMKSASVKEGSTVTFSCDAEGSGVLTYNWYFNGREIFPASGSRRMVQGNKMTIERVAKTDIGNYACNATSLSGYAYGQSTLNVLPIEGADGAASCHEVHALRSELETVKDSLQSLRDFVQNTNTAQADASISLIQRIASKLQILTKDEEELIAAQNQFAKDQQSIAVRADIQKKANNRNQEAPQFLYAENVQNHRNKPEQENKDENKTAVTDKNESDVEADDTTVVDKPTESPQESSPDKQEQSTQNE